MIRPLRLSVTVCDRLDDFKHCALCKYNLDCYCRENTDDIMNVQTIPSDDITASAGTGYINIIRILGGPGIGSMVGG